MRVKSMVSKEMIEGMAAAHVEAQEETPMAWELVESSGDLAKQVSTFRAAVPGGWLVTVFYMGQSASVTFVPDPEHKWENGTTRKQLKVLSKG